MSTDARLSPAAYHIRAQQVYWNHAPACGSKGPNKASGLLEPDHDGKWCEGNGYDSYGPMYRCWENSR